MDRYLFVHFRERSTPDGEQVYFSVSRDGFHWEEINGGAPVLWAYYGRKGVRDHTAVRNPETGKVTILSTDLSIAYGVREWRKDFWRKAGTEGSTSLAVWESDDLVNWSEERLLDLSPRKKEKAFGCVWAPDAIWIKEKGAYLLHWSSSVPAESGEKKAVYAAWTRDFRDIREPFLLYEEKENEVIDSALYEENGAYYLFLKYGAPSRIRLLRSESPTGPFTFVTAFDEAMRSVEEGLYEAPTAVRLPDGTWALFLDFYGASGSEQGYRPFLAGSLESGAFKKADGVFSFPYRFKHGTILCITEEEYLRLKNHDWTDKGFAGYFD